MNGFTSKGTGGFLMAIGVIGVLAVVSLLLFFMSFFLDMRFFSSMGSLNDGINSLLGILSAVLAAMLFPSMQRSGMRGSLVSLAGAWIGAMAALYGSWLILTGQGDVERSSYFYFFGFGLIGIWVWVLSQVTRRRAIWPQHLTRWGRIAGGVMMVGLLAFYGIWMGWDGNDSSPLIQMSGISFLGTGILYPIWCLRMGSWVLANQEQSSREGFLHE